MAIVAIFEMSGMTADQYEQIIQSLADAGQEHPDGRIQHLGATMDEGMIVADVWESEEHLGRFAEELMPLIQQSGVELPQPRVYPVHTILTD
jgi:hypothetical protein